MPKHTHSLSLSLSHLLLLRFYIECGRKQNNNSMVWGTNIYALALAVVPQRTRCYYVLCAFEIEIVQFSYYLKLWEHISVITEFLKKHWIVPHFFFNFSLQNTKKIKVFSVIFRDSDCYYFSIRYNTGQNRIQEQTSIYLSFIDRN